MPYAELFPDDARRIQVVTTFADRYLIRQLPGANYHGDSQSWRVPRSWAACVTLRGLFGADLEVGPGLAAWSREEYTERIAPATMLRDLLDLTGVAQSDQRFARILAQLGEVEETTPGVLFPYQRVDAAFFYVNRHAILANPMGLGKSASAIRTLQLLQLAHGRDIFPALVISPNTVKMTWADELHKFAPNLVVSVINGSAGQRRKALGLDADVYVVNWESLRIHSRLRGYGSMSLPDEDKVPKELNKLGLRTVIADEAHHAKDPHAKQTRAMWALMHEAEYRYAMSGTPVVDNVGDLWSLLHAVEPEGFPGKARYIERWAQVQHGFFGGTEVLGLNPATADEFRRITDPLIRRVPKAAALPQLPEKFPVTYRYTEMSQAQSKLYRAMEDDMIAVVRNAEQEGELLSATNAISQLTRLLQFAAASAEVSTEMVKDKETGEDKPVQRVHLKMPSAKVDDLMELLDEMGEEPLVVAAVSRQLIELAAARLAKAGISYGLITGTQTTDERQQAVSMFQEGKLRVILLTIDAGGEGITLTRASTLLFMQRHWSKVKNDQCEDRIWRIGQRNAVQIIDQIAPGTVEYRKLLSITEKGIRIEEIVRDKETLLKLLGA